MLSLEDRLDLYEEAVEYLLRCEESSEVVNELVNREEITNALLRGQTLTPAQQAQLDAADARLRVALPILITRFPTLFTDRDDIPTAYWWWHADQSQDQQRTASHSTETLQERTHQ
ncbi:MAG: hypothetical protein AB4911_15740 [Oscillochloridaceae bacterium umkhey_bin13]